ncbi:MAG: NAD-dependent epimerase/dehydratase family protein [Betaproteobacteria bacterium]|nr:MAG: NAD-dependent epimerase/dehydratase family protein [Betaproteobacteria bacterium]
MGHRCVAGSTVQQTRLALARSESGFEALLIAVTGASGYIGAHCVAHALKREHAVIAISTQAVVTATSRVSNALRWQQVGNYADIDVAEWTERFLGASTVIHAAARVHRRRAQGDDEAMLRDNMQLTARAARAAAAARVRRFVFLSSAAVYGDAGNDAPFDEHSALNPQSAYARSKFAAEAVLREIANESSMQIVILRPPVVYGVNAPGNLSRLARAVLRGVPLPFARVDNQRSIVAVDTVASCAVWSAEAAAVDQSVSVWLPCDRQPISTKSMIEALARGMRVAPKLISVPKPLLSLGLRTVGAKRLALQLLEDWRLDGSALSRAGFEAQVDSEIGLELLGRSYNQA